MERICSPLTLGGVEQWEAVNESVTQYLNMKITKHNTPLTQRMESGPQVLLLNRLHEDELQLFSDLMGRKLVALLYNRESPLSEEVRQKAQRTGILTVELSKTGGIEENRSFIQQTLGDEGIALFLPSNETNYDALLNKSSVNMLCELGVPVTPVAAKIETSLCFNTGFLRSEKTGFLLVGHQLGVEKLTPIQALGELLQCQERMTSSIVDAYTRREQKNGFFNIPLSTTIN